MVDGSPDNLKFIPTAQAYADRIASERIGLAGTHQLDRKLAEYLIELGEDVDPDDIAD